MNSIIIVGDLFPVSSNAKYFAQGDIKHLFGKNICDLFAQADYRICNLEGALTDGNDRCVKTGPVITASTDTVLAYKNLGIDLCMLANNHITDGGNQGVIDTMRTLDKAGIRHIGGGINESSIPHYLIHTLADKKVCIYNVCERMYNKSTATKAGAWIYDEYVVCKELEALKSQCDYLIVIYHGGIEKFRYPSPEIKKRFHRMADSGADVVISQHTHCIGCEEYYNGAYLLYGQGDFLLMNFRPELTNLGLIVEILIDKNGMKIKKHMVKCSNVLRLEYVENPDFASFDERSKKVQDDKYLEEQFRKFSKQELRLYLNAFKSPNRFLYAIKRLFPKLYFNWLISKAYHRNDLLFSLHTLRSEQNREIAIAGIETLLNIK